jgi:hypothetical protein
MNYVEEICRIDLKINREFFMFFSIIEESGHPLSSILLAQDFFRALI